MSKSEQLKKHSLECLRLEADCMQLAGDAANPKLQSHFLRMARVWFTLAISGPSGHTGEGFSKAKMRTT